MNMTEGQGKEFNFFTLGLLGFFFLFCSLSSLVLLMKFLIIKPPPLDEQLKEEEIVMGKD
jgi:hypothetical protein